MPEARTRTRTSPGPAVGRGASTTSNPSGAPELNNMVARFDQVPILAISRPRGATRATTVGRKAGLVIDGDQSHGPTQTFATSALMSAIWGKADSLCSTRGFPRLTHLRHQRAFCCDAQYRWDLKHCARLSVGLEGATKCDGAG